MTVYHTNLITEATFKPSINLFTRLASMIELAKQRKRLAELDADQLADIGVSRDDAMMEAARPSWDAPHNWR